MDTDASFSILRSNFEATLADSLRAYSEELGLSATDALNRVSAQWLGYDLEDEQFVDGSGDCGIDFWFVHTNGFDIFQTKMHDLAPDGSIQRGRFDGSGIRDLQRARSFLLSDAPIESLNPRLQPLRSRWDFTIAGRRDTQEPDPVVVNLILLVLGDGLTPPAELELQRFSTSLQTADSFAGIPIGFKPALYTLDTLIDARWREQNREWRDVTGRKRSSITLSPHDAEFVGGTKDVVFFCKAMDLVSAYHEFGYQIFEPNVRAHIRKSRVNAAIEESVRHRGSRHEFRLLNNGVTITCTGYSRPTENRAHFVVREPGVVNGLQTVVALHSGYQKLPLPDKEDFEANCLVLVRLLQQNAVADINRVVLTTNNQNPMQPRNLVSNRAEQIYYEQLFAERGWFYERKEGAWDAFSSDPQRWRTLPNRRPKHFHAPSTRGRPRIKKVDNEDLAQTWLSFIGFSREAANFKRELFDDKWYEFVFLRQLPAHAAEYQYQLERAQADCIKQAPDVDLLLLSWLTRELARALAPSAKQNREEALVRLGIVPSSISKEQLEVQLAQDFDYAFGQVLRGSSLLFSETFGYMLYRAIGNPNGKGSRVLAKGTLRHLKDSFDLEATSRSISTDEADQSDILAVAWGAFTYILTTLLEGPWRESYRAAPVKSRFLLSPDTRARIAKELDHLDDYLSKRELARSWAAAIQRGQGLYGFIRDRVLE